MPLDSYRALGRSGLAVSPLALGAMTFGTKRWGTDEEASRAVFDAYVERGGNFVDTADVYSGGASEEMVGRFIAERGLRDQVVIATKAGFSTGQGAHNGGLGARHLHAALDGSLRRLGTDHVDLYWTHVWDGVTPAEELVETMAALVRSGKVRYWAMSNAPAWYMARAATLAQAHGQPGPIAVQSFYSLVNRDVEAEHAPMAADLGLGLVPWSPLAYGLLTGKYDRAAVERDIAAKGPKAGGLPNEAGAPGEARAEGDGRLDGANPFGDSLFTERNWGIVDVLAQVAEEAGESMARVALAWVAGRPGVSSVLMGVSRPAQVADNAGAVDLALSADHRARLDAASAPAGAMIYGLFSPAMRRQVTFGGQSVAAWGE